MAGRAILVTGGAGALGGAVVDAFLRGGDRVVVPWIVSAERDALAERESEALAAGRLTLLEADVADDAGARAAVEATPGLWAAVCAVGGFGGGDPIDATDLALWDRLYRLNLRSAAATSRAAAPGLRARGGGALVFVASRAAWDCPAGLAAYSATKAGVISLVRSLDAELGLHGVRVNAVVPTTIDTPANRAAMPGVDPAAWTPPREIAAVIQWLCGDASARVRGGLVPV